MPVEEYRKQVEAFSTDLSREHYMYFSGQKDRLELACLYERYSDLYSLDAVTEIRRWRSEASPQYSAIPQSLDKLLAFAVEHHLQMATRGISEQISEYESKAQITWQGRMLGFYESFVVLANEPDPSARRQLALRAGEVISRGNDLRTERIARQREACVALGFPSYLAAYTSTRHIDYTSLFKPIMEFLQATDRFYTTSLRRALANEIGVGLEDAHRSDVGYFSRLKRFDPHFPKEDLVACYNASMAGLEIDVARQTNITLDIEPRPRKHPRAFCSPIMIPDEIKLVITPHGGADDYAAFLHEAGHAQHMGWTSRRLTIEDRALGDRSVSEAYAFLFNYFIADTDWLTDILRFKNHEDFHQLQKLLKLHIIRRYAGKLRYELELHDSPSVHRDLASTYARYLTEATRFQYDPVEYLYDLDDGFYSADYLRAWIFEAQLRDHLRRRFGRSWFKSKKAGLFLMELWETGERYGADDLAAQIGLGSLDTGALLAEFHDAA
ncbi:MAG: hypothetical protein HYR55_19300 [Acidobacteria bacterium]|nr:hypothetical protein [Acidobacteriota bacterium]MBI3655817.1 hypothetical protein [Acidobacteriota bacterium]